MKSDFPILGNGVYYFIVIEKKFSKGFSYFAIRNDSSCGTPAVFGQGDGASVAP